jgi:hypothetical protein
MTNLKIFKLSQSVNSGYDTCDSCVIIAHEENEAKAISQGLEHGIHEDGTILYPSWAPSENITAEYLGKAKEGSKVGLVIRSFNAG